MIQLLNYHERTNTGAGDVPIVQHHSAVVFDNKIWVIGGSVENNGNARGVIYYGESLSLFILMKKCCLI